MKVPAAAVIVLLLWFITGLLGTNDSLSGLLLLFTTVIIYMAAVEIQQSSRHAFAAATDKGGRLHQHLSSGSNWARLLALVMSFVLASALTVMLKGIVINHGIVVPLLILFLFGLFILGVLERSGALSERCEGELEKVVHNYATSVVVVLVLSLIVNFIFSLLLSAKDVYAYVVSTVDFTNFENVALEDAISANGQNGISRVFINLYLLVDAFKVSVANQLSVSLLGVDEESRENYFYSFFFLVFLLNLVKLAPFSLAFVFLVTGLRKHVEHFYPRIRSRVVKFSALIAQKIQPGWQRFFNKPAGAEAPVSDTAGAEPMGENSGKE